MSVRTYYCVCFLFAFSYGHLYFREELYVIYINEAFANFDMLNLRAAQDWQNS